MEDCQTYDDPRNLVCPQPKAGGRSTQKHIKTKGIQSEFTDVFEANFKIFFEIKIKLQNMNLLPMDFHRQENIFILLSPTLPFLNNSHPIPFLHSLLHKSLIFLKQIIRAQQKNGSGKGNIQTLKAESTINLLVFSLLSFWRPSQCKISLFLLAACVRKTVLSHNINLF